MKPSPLELERYFFTKVQVVAIPDNETIVPHQVQTDVELAQNKENALRFLVKMNVLVGKDLSEKPNYRAEISVFGFFRVRPDYTGNAAQLAGVNGASILFAAVREMLANVTSRGPWPHISLQCNSFSDLGDQTEERQSPSAIQRVSKRKASVSARLKPSAIK